jgi:uracil-DNA glycosylase family 4
MSTTRRSYLEVMGIQVWELRRPLGEAPLPEQPTALAGTSMDEELLAAEVPENPPDRPAEYADPSEFGEGAERDQELDLPPGNDRTAGIARMDWEELQDKVSRCTACGLHTGRTQTVFGVGNRQAQWMIIGEAPGADEDRLGEPFVGRAGKLLDAMLKALGLQRQEVYIANILKCRPPNNRDPLPEEARCCWPFLERQIALIRPGIILAVGRIAAQMLLQTEVPIGKLRGRVYRLAGRGIPLVVSYHPAYLLRAPREKRKSWDDLQLARHTLNAELHTSRSTAE